MGRMEWTRARNVISRVILCRWNEPLHSRSLGRQGTHPKAVRCMLPVSGRLDRTGLVVSMAQAPRVWRPRLPIRQTNRIGRARRETSPAFGAGDRPASPRSRTSRVGRAAGVRTRGHASATAGCFSALSPHSPRRTGAGTVAGSEGAKGEARCNGVVAELFRRRPPACVRSSSRRPQYRTLALGSAG